MIHPDAHINCKNEARAALIGGTIMVGVGVAVGLVVWPLTLTILGSIATCFAFGAFIGVLICKSTDLSSKH